MANDKEEADTWFEIGFEDEAWKREKTNTTFHKIRERMREEDEEEAVRNSNERELSGWRGYYPLVMAANLVAGLPESTALRTSLPSYPIWAKARSARERGWCVNGGLSRPREDLAIPVRQVQREEGSLVYLSDFVEWAIEAGCTVAPSAVKEAQKQCNASDTFERRVRLWEIERTRAELHDSKTGETEVILARDARITELDREWGKILESLQGCDLAPERTDTPAANAGADGCMDEPSADSDYETEAPSEDTLGRREQQVKVILETATKLGYDPLAIPFGGKAKIKTQCEEDEALFESTSFEHAWKEARKRELVRMVNTHKYAKRE